MSGVALPNGATSGESGMPISKGGEEPQQEKGESEELQMVMEWLEEGQRPRDTRQKGQPVLSGH